MLHLFCCNYFVAFNGPLIPWKNDAKIPINHDKKGEKFSYFLPNDCAIMMQHLDKKGGENE
jgi:hypothetical protein